MDKKQSVPCTIETAIKHYEALQKRYTKTHNGKMCEITQLTLNTLNKAKGAEHE